MLVGGLIGAIASFDTDSHPVALAAGSHYESDKLYLVNTTTIVLTSNTTTVAITIDFDAEQMSYEGYRARSVGSLIGLVMNGYQDGSSYLTTNLNLASNTATGTITVSNEEAFRFYDTNGIYYSSLGHGKIVNNIYTRTQHAGVGASYDLLKYGDFSNITLPIVTLPEVEEPTE